MARESITNHELTDHEITHLVMEAISQDRRVPISKVRVTVEDGDITLTGIVDSVGEKLAAEEDAKRTPGITEVLNYIVVKPERAVGDQEIVVNVIDALRQDGRVLAGHYEAMAKDRVVTLRGEAVTEMEKRAALDDACLTYGVEQVNDEINLLPQGADSDHIIEEQVAEELSRAPSINERLIHAHVQDGVVYLHGVVDFPQQIEEAERVARDVFGVRDVKNDLSAQLSA